MPSDAERGRPCIVETSAMAAGGEAVARLEDGRVVFVAGALPDETVAVVVTKGARDFARARVETVLRPATDRREPPCPRVAAGCGGCQWQHIAPEAQPELKAAIVRDALRRVGRFRGHDEVVRAGVALPGTRYRTTVRAAIAPDGRPGYRMAHSQAVCVSGPCLVAHPVIARVLDEGRFLGAKEVTIRYAVSSGELSVTTSPPEAPVDLPDDIRAMVRPDGIVHERVADTAFAISAGAFFQVRPDGAAALVDSVADALGLPAAGSYAAGSYAAGSYAPGSDHGSYAPGSEHDGARLIDLYGGVGLFAATLAGRGRWAEVWTIERGASASADAVVNLAGDSRSRVVHDDVDRWRAPAFAGRTFVVADPARAGLGKAGVGAIVATNPTRIALVSCDPAAFARDAALLVERGFNLVDAVLVDLFPHTFHVEVVGRFDSIRIAEGTGNLGDDGP